MASLDISREKLFSDVVVVVAKHDMNIDENRSDSTRFAAHSSSNYCKFSFENFIALLKCNLNLEILNDGADIEINASNWSRNRIEKKRKTKNIVKSSFEQFVQLFDSNFISIFEKSIFSLIAIICKCKRNETKRKSDK